MIYNNVRALIINMREDREKKENMIKLMQQLGVDDFQILNAFEGKDVQFTDDNRSVKFGDAVYEYGPYTGEMAFRREYLSRRYIGCSLSNKIAQNAQKPGVHTIIFEDDANFVGKPGDWEGYMSNLPSQDDYDIIFLSDCTWSSTAYPKGEYYNSHYSYLPSPYFDISGTHAYIINAKALDILNSNFSLRLAADDYLNYCISTFKLRVLVPNEPLFSQKPLKKSPVPLLARYKIVFYNMIGNESYPDYSRIEVPDNFEIISGEEYLNEGDVVIFHMPTLKLRGEEMKRIKKRKGQLWVFWSMECEVHHQNLHSPEMLSLFDIMATYKLDADIPVPYFAGLNDRLWRHEPVAKTELVNAFISSDFDQSNRLKYLSDLMSCLEVHSYGKAFTNRQLIDDRGPKTKIDVISRYKFTIAFENAIAKDYVTEKFFHPLIMGSVPVYLGAPNVDEFAPGDNCYINVNSFATVRELAEYLLMLDGNDELYNKYLSWKTLPFRSRFETMLHAVHQEPLARLFKKVGQRLAERVSLEKQCEIFQPDAR